MKRVVVTGLGSINPLGNNRKTTWENLKKGVSGADKISRFDYSLFKTQFACEVKNYNSNDYFERKELRKLDLFSQFALISSKEALEDANLLDIKNPDRAGVIWGTGIGGIRTFEIESEKYFTKEPDQMARLSPFFIPKMIIDIAPGLISMKYNLRGPNFATVSACASSTNAIVDAFNYIKLGHADIFVTGGSEAAITELSISGFNSMHALSKRNEDPKTASRPFDKGRDGFVMGEGSTAIILEEYEHAKARGAKIYAELVGAGLSADAHHLTAPHPEGIGAKKVMENALNNANLDPTAIDYINVHGTSTPLGDIAEVKAIQDLFKDHAYNLNISSSKSMTGHLLGATGAFEAFVCIKSVHENIITPTINHFELDENIDSNLNFTFNKAQEREVNYALSNTFGFGGHNASVIFKKY